MRARLVLIPILAAAALLAGCNKTNTPTPPTPTDNGIAALSADEILARATAALAAAPAYTLKGEATEEGKKVSIDFQASGSNKKANVSLEGTTIEAIIIGPDLYVKFPEDALSSLIPPGQEAVLALMKGKYIKVSASDTRFKDAATLLDTSEFLKPEGTVTKGDRSVIDGIPVITLIDTKDGKPNGSMAIATVGEPRPIQLADDTGTGVAKFTYPASLTISAPPSDQVFDLKSLLGSS